MEDPDTERTEAEDLELLHTLCSVWIDGPYAQRYFARRDMAIAACAAREIRKAIELSVIHDCELCLEHAEMLARIEVRLAAGSPEYLSGGSGFLRAVLTRVRHAIRSIRALRPLQSRPG